MRGKNKMGEFLFLLVVAGIIFAVVRSKKKAKAKREAAFEEKSNFKYDALTKIKTEHGFKEKGNKFYTDDNFFEEYRDREIVIDTDAKKVAFISPKHKRLDVVDAKDILSVEVKEDHGSNHTQSNNVAITGYSASTNGFVKRVLVMIVTKTAGSFELCTYYNHDGHSSKERYYSKQYGYAVEIKALIEEMKGSSQPVSSVKSSGSVTDELKRLKDLHNEGVLTEEEFSKAKEKLLA